ncbi:hypothetical protein [uncultured Draconibacterium sp.]|uniref:hypothetical protein n=1 Tax=uncultured Draconibacterium sp. TaxID=1573823 RepID=UPI003216A8A8
MLRFIVLIVLAGFTQIAYAQVRATTESGNKVILYDNGTWKYEEKTITQDSQTEKKVAVITTPVEVETIKIDSSRQYETESTEILYETSKTLERYFGEEKGRIRGRMSCVNTLGDIQIRYVWEIPVGDGQRYVGQFKAGSKITVHLMNGDKVELQVGEDSKLEPRPKYNFTAISGLTKALTNEQLVALTGQPFRQLEVEWKKKTDVFEVDPSIYFIENLPRVF